MDTHRSDLEKLAEKDPEFYKFLKEQDADLLEFNESDYEMEEDVAEGNKNDITKRIITVFKVVNKKRKFWTKKLKLANTH